MSKYFKFKFLIKAILIITIISVLVSFLINLWIHSQVSNYIYSDYSQISNFPNALVLGARQNVLTDRVSVASQLYLDDKVEKLIMSGDGDLSDGDVVNEPQLMASIATNLGVDITDIDKDAKGFDTFLSCKNYKEKYGSKKVIIITQSWHIDRAVYICRKLGVNAYGFSSDPGAPGVLEGRKYLDVDWNYWRFRDYVANVDIFFKLLFY